MLGFLAAPFLFFWPGPGILAYRDGFGKAGAVNTALESNNEVLKTVAEGEKTRKRSNQDTKARNKDLGALESHDVMTKRHDVILGFPKGTGKCANLD